MAGVAAAAYVRTFTSFAGGDKTKARALNVMLHLALSFINTAVLWCRVRRHSKLLTRSSRAPVG